MGCREPVAPPASARASGATTVAVHFPAQGFAETVSRVRPCVAMLSVVHNAAYHATAEVTTGAGAVIDPAGLVLTCDHVIEGADLVRVQVPGHPAMDATVLGRDPLGDLALLSVTPPEPLAALELGDSDGLRPGDFVLAFGNPFNHSRRDAEPSVSLGIVSALGRSTFPQGGRRRYTGAIQIDASINPGNSGGPLVDAQGRLVGVVGVISSRTGYNAGVAFAIPARRVRQVLPTLRAGVTVRHAWLGVVPADPGLGTGARGGSEGESAAESGVVLAEVLPDQPAARAGLQARDVVLRLGAQRTDHTAAFMEAVSRLTPGQRVAVRVRRGTQELTVEVVVGTRPDEDADPWPKK